MEIDNIDDLVNQIKIIILGDMSVGKTSILTKYCKNIFTNNNLCTIGVDCYNMHLKHNDEYYSVNLWDTSGQEKYRSISKNYLKNIEGVIIVYDISSESSFKNLNYWVDFLLKENYIIPIIIVGNKLDLNSDKRKVSSQSGIDLSKKINTRLLSNIINYDDSNNLVLCNFVESSAKTGQNIAEIFQILITSIVECNINILSSSKINLKIDKKNSENKEKKQWC